jgi:hypothetical protein
MSEATIVSITREVEVGGLKTMSKILRVSEFKIGEEATQTKHDSLNRE